MIARRVLWTFALAAPAVVAAENLMPVVAPPTFAIPDANGKGYPWERVTEARARGWDHYRRHRGYGPDPVGHFIQPSRRWKPSFWHAGRFAPIPNDAPFTTLWINGLGTERLAINYLGGEAWSQRGLSPELTNLLKREADRVVLYDGEAALPDLVRFPAEERARRAAAHAAERGFFDP